MKFLEYLYDIRENSKKLTSEATSEISVLWSSFNEKYKPIELIIEKKKLIFLALLILVFVSYFPLLSVWLLASLATLYEGGKILNSLIEDNRIKKENKFKHEMLMSYLKGVINDKQMISLQIKANNKFIDRQILVVSVNDDALISKDPSSKIIISYPWYKINVDELYDREVAPTVKNEDNEKKLRQVEIFDFGISKVIKALRIKLERD